MGKYKKGNKKNKNSVTVSVDDSKTTPLTVADDNGINVYNQTINGPYWSKYPHVDKTSNVMFPNINIVGSGIYDKISTYKYTIELMKDMIGQLPLPFGRGLRREEQGQLVD